LLTTLRVWTIWVLECWPQVWACSIFYCHKFVYVLYI
jgi:hypothetical protein